jgi:phosphate/phosphite/phosphonate ABC transporter binding protein
MIHFFYKYIIIAIIAICLLVVSLNADSKTQGIKIAILPCTNIVMTFKKFYPLVEYLARETELQVELVIPKDFAEFKSEIKNDEIDFALQDPHTYVKLADLFDQGNLLRALSMEGGATQSGVVIVRKDSRTTDIKELKGKTVMFGPTLSSAKWLAARILFEDNGINLEKDLKAYSHGGCCEDIAFSVYLKAVDAGVVCDHFLAEHEEKQKELGVVAEQIQPLIRTKSVPTRVFGARTNLNKDLVARVKEALLRLDNKNPQQASILARAELGGFQRSKDEEYDSIRRLMAVTAGD